MTVLVSFRFFFAMVVAVALLGGAVAFRPATPVLGRSALQTFARKTVVSGSDNAVPKEISKAAKDAETSREDKKTLSKSDVVSILQQRTQFHKDDIARVLTTFSDVIYQEVFENGKEIRMKDFGTFKQKSRSARRVRNPQTGDMIDVGAKKSVGFTPSSILKAEI